MLSYLNYVVFILCQVDNIARYIKIVLVGIQMEVFLFFVGNLAPCSLGSNDTWR